MRKAKAHRRALRPFRRLIAEPLEPRLPLTISPQLLVDINGGAAPSSPGPATVIGSTAYFAATTSAGGTELWKTDGTPAGTLLIKDIQPGTGSSNPRFLTNVNGTLFFRANDGVHGDEIWKSDGTDAGTTLVSDIVLGNGEASNPANLINGNGQLYFTADPVSTGNTTYYGPSPYLSAADSPFDFSQLGTNFWLEDFEDGQLNTPGVSASFGAPRNPSSLTDSVDVDDGMIDGDGHLGHSFLVRPEAPGVTFTFDRQALGGLPSYVGLVVTGGDPAYPDNNVDFFDAGGNPIGTRTDSFPKPISGVTSDDRFVGMFHAGGISAVRVSGPLGIGNSAFELDHLQYGVVVQPVGAMELWRLDPGTATPIQDLGYQPNFRAANIGDTLYFTGNDAAGGIELWKTSAATTSQVMDINPGPASSNPRALINISGTLCFSANDGVNGDELWKFDSNNTTLVKDIRPGSAGSGVGSLTNLNGILMFSATDGTTGNELWRSDGTQNGTVLVSDIKSGSNSSSPQNFANVNGTLFFVADDGAHFFELWKSDGTAAGTVLVKDIWPGDHTSNSNSLSNIGGTLVFAAGNGQNGNELWQSDGTAVGTVAAPDIAAGALDSSPQNLRKLGNSVIFSADDGVHGRELWTARLVSAAGTVDVDGKANIFGAGHSAPPGSAPGILPMRINLPAGQYRSMQFSVTGQVSFDVVQPGTRPYYDAEGGPEASNVFSTGGISGIRADTYGYLVGVFLGPSEPVDPAPASLDFRSATSFTVLAPLLNQTFFIGDALTGRAMGAKQTFLVPDGATRLYLGLADTYDPPTDTITGTPKAYDDNGGSFQVTYKLDGTPVNAAPHFTKGPDITAASEHAYGPSQTVITFDKLKGLTGQGEPFVQYTEKAFVVTPPAGIWNVLATSSPTPTAAGNPAPAIWEETFSSSLEVTSATGGTFTFAGLDFFGPSAAITFTGLLNGQTVYYSMTTVPADAPSLFQPIASPSGATIDKLLVSIQRNNTENTKIDNIRLTSANWATDVSPGAPDESGQALNFDVMSDRADLFTVGPAIDPFGQLTFTPQPNLEGVALLTVTLHDDGGILSGGIDTSSPQTFKIEIAKPHRWTNDIIQLDVNGDGFTAPNDAVAIVNYLNAGLPAAVLSTAEIGGPYGFLDTDHDDTISPNDVLQIINFINAGGQNGPAGSAIFAGKDFTTSGDWQSQYGADGYALAIGVAGLPTYAQLAFSGKYDVISDDHAGEDRALQYVDTTYRFAADWTGHNSSSIPLNGFVMDLNLTDDQTHRVAIYILDWNTTSRSEQIEVLDASTGDVLNSQLSGPFHDGHYLIWQLRGHVLIRFTNLANGLNAVASGIFFG
jgi:ELWxxDGT repeat protein